MNFQFFRSIRVRLTLWYVAVLALILVGLGAVLSHTVRHDVSVAMDQEMLRGGRRFAGRVSRWDLFRVPTPKEWEEIRKEREKAEPDQTPNTPGVVASSTKSRPSGPNPDPSEGPDTDRRNYFRTAAILGPSSIPLTPFSKWEPWDKATFARSLQGQDCLSTILDREDPARVVSTPIRKNGQIIGVLQTAVPLADQIRLNDRLQQRLLTLIPVGLFIAFVGGMFLTDRALRPVRRVTEAAEELGAHDLSQRLEVTSQDELGQLATTFNGMLTRLEDAFREMNHAYADLESSYEQQRRFTGDASHELRTPLTRIKASTSLALKGERTPTEYRRALQVADQAADTMNRMIQDLLLLARSDGDQLELRRRAIPVAEMLRRVVAAVPAADERQVDLDLPPQPLTVDGDPDQVARLLVNLLENALRHTPPEGWVTLGAREANGMVELTVTDTGEGIAPEHLPHICDRFYRVDAARSRSRGGTGLGLAICQSLVEAHGGTLTIESQVGEGTTVHVRLPRAQVALTETEPALAIL